MSREFNLNFDIDKAVYSLKRTYIPQQLKSPYSYFSLPTKALTYTLNSQKINFEVQPLSCENHCLSTGFTVHSYAYVLHIWDDLNALKYTMNCNPNLKNSPYKGFYHYIAYTPSQHNALNYMGELIEFPQFDFSSIKQSVFLDKKSKQKIVYASVQVFINIEFNERLFDGSDPDFKERFMFYELVLEYPISEVILEYKSFWLSTTFWIFFVIALIIMAISFYFGKKLQSKTNKRLCIIILMLKIQKVHNLEIGLKPISKELPDLQSNQRVISFQQYRQNE